MGPAIDALRPAVTVTGRKPAFLAAALVTLVGTGIASVVVGRIPVVGELVNSVLVTPAFAALLLGMAAAGLTTDAASLGDGVESLRASYRSLVGAYAILVAGVLLVVVAWAVEVGVVLLFGSGFDPATAVAATDAASLGATTEATTVGVDPEAMSARTAWSILAFTLLALAIVLVGGLAVQFFDVAIVVGGATALSSFGASYRLFRDAPASVVGYSVLRMLPVVAAGVLVAGGYVVGASLAGRTGSVLFAVPVAAVVAPVTFAFITSYHVAYYDVRMAERPDGGAGSTNAADS